MNCTVFMRWAVTYFTATWRPLGALLDGIIYKIWLYVLFLYIFQLSRRELFLHITGSHVSGATALLCTSQFFDFFSLKYQSFLVWTILSKLRSSSTEKLQWDP